MVYWFEEPVPPEDVDGYIEVRQKSKILIAGGECEYTRYGFRELSHSSNMTAPPTHSETGWHRSSSRCGAAISISRIAPAWG